MCAFDVISTYPDFLMRKCYESFNEVRLLREHMDRISGNEFFEIGCATGELRRYVEKYLPRFSYTGFDISRPAIARARAKYAWARYRLLEGPISTFREIHGAADVVFCRDVVLHQFDPYAFISSLLEIAREALVLRLRTRDVGETVRDAERSCQYHWTRHWVPYIVLNTQEMIDKIAQDRTVSEIVVSRRYEPLGGHNWRHLPKELFYTETRSAETAVIVLKQQTPRQGDPKVTFDDRPDGPRFSLFERAYMRLFARRRRQSRTSP